MRLSKKFRNLKIFSYDPIDKNIQRLNHSIKINIIENIQTFCLAIGDKETIVELGATEDYSPNYEIGEKNAVVTEKCKMNLLDNLHNLENKNIIFNKYDGELIVPQKKIRYFYELLKCKIQWLYLILINYK